MPAAERDLCLLRDAHTRSGTTQPRIQWVSGSLPHKLIAWTWRRPLTTSNCRG